MVTTYIVWWPFRALVDHIVACRKNAWRLYGLTRIPDQHDKTSKETLLCIGSTDMSLDLVFVQLISSTQKRCVLLARAARDSPQASRLFGEKRIIHQEIKQALLTHAGTLLIIISLLFQLEMYNYASIKLAWGINNNNHNQPYIAYDKMIINSLCVWLFFFSAVEYSWLLVMMSLISPAAIILLLLQY